MCMHAPGFAEVLHDRLHQLLLTRGVYPRDVDGQDGRSREPIAELGITSKRIKCTRGESEVGHQVWVMGGGRLGAAGKVENEEK